MLRSCVNGSVVIPFPARTPPIRRTGARLEIRSRAARLEIILLNATLPPPAPAIDPARALRHILASVLG